MRPFLTGEIHFVCTYDCTYIKFFSKFASVWLQINEKQNTDFVVDLTGCFVVDTAEREFDCLECFFLPLPTHLARPEKTIYLSSSRKSKLTSEELCLL
jgi:hypothetical protein